MSTKQHPGRYDCYAKLVDDEPYFVLRAKDPDAPALVEEWARRRAARPGNEHNPKLDEARGTAQAMRGWRLKNMSAQPCGCDPGENHLCERHAGMTTLERDSDKSPEAEAGRAR